MATINEFSQLDAHTPATRKLACRAVKVGALKAKTQQRLLYIFFKVGHIYGIKLL